MLVESAQINRFLAKSAQKNPTKSAIFCFGKVSPENFRKYVSENPMKFDFHDLSEAL